VKTLHSSTSSSKKSALQPPDTPWIVSLEDSVKKLQVDPTKGLSTAEAGVRRQTFGQNMLRQVKPKSPLTIIINQLNNLIVYFLIAAAALSFTFGEHIEAIAIGLVIIINTVIGFLI